MNIWNKVISLAKAPTHSLSERVDTYRAALALKCYLFAKENNINEPSKEQIENIYSYVNKMDHNRLNDFVQKCILSQITHMFTTLEDSNDQSKSSSTKFKVQFDQEILLKKIGFTLSCKASNIPSANEGLFINTLNGCSILPGTLIGIYPGYVHIKEHLRDKEHVKILLPDDQLMLMQRTDQCIIDGRSVDLVPSNPYGLFHKINHCGVGKPNVMQISFDFPGDNILEEGFPNHLRKYIPNKYPKPISFFGNLETYGIYMKSIVFISSRYLSDQDELVMDYRLNPNLQELPSWYKPFDIEDVLSRYE